ncbi:MAG: ACP S-malonyltransferase [Bdellovibrionaceae bacterium]|nr:ACP S-malonyltransferase [Bdellovibrionales bacterium]MCB9084442.1 ACP S-malonyltransferase [Pseudobdellovibrionaceae bacterium]
MSEQRKRVVVICPGRGTYTKETLGYLKPHRMNQVSFLADLDQRRSADQQPTVSELDNADQFSTNLHTKGENASVLIYACSYCDFAQLDRDQYEVVAITGNSMGWYLTLAIAGSLDWEGAYKVINTMGSMMKGGIVGGQVIYPMTDENWLPDYDRMELVEGLLREAYYMEEVEIYPSIFLGGYLVFGGNKPGLEFLMKSLPQVEHFPFQLVNHAAFHTPLLRETSEKAMQQISSSLFAKPKIPMIDGRGHIWKPFSTEIQDLYHYTLGHQVVAPYDFSAAVTVALKEFNPDQLILLGPGNTLGGSIGQILVQNQWKGITDKESFSTRQQQNPFLVSLGR